GITDQLAQLDLPSPQGFAFPTRGEAAAALADNHPFDDARTTTTTTGRRAAGAAGAAAGGAGSGASSHARTPSNADQLAARLASMPLPNPERLDEASTRARRESISEQLSAQLAGMSLPRPERIFGGDDQDPSAQRPGGVGPDAWDKVTLAEGEEIPEAVRRGSVVGITSPTASSHAATFAGPPMVDGRNKPSIRGAKPSLSSIKDVGETPEPAQPARKTASGTIAAPSTAPAPVP
ncbi:hypothetical protein NliqN6_3912, partial [Naganishia liquefaciens]